jgi:hypothetical protein
MNGNSDTTPTTIVIEGCGPRGVESTWCLMPDGSLIRVIKTDPDEACEHQIARSE